MCSVLFNVHDWLAFSVNGFSYDSVERSWWDVATIDGPRQNYLYQTKFQRKVPLILEVPECPHKTVQNRLKEATVSKQVRFVQPIRFDRTPTCDRHRQTQGHSHYRGSVAPVKTIAKLAAQFPHISVAAGFALTHSGRLAVVLACGWFCVTSSS